MKTTDVKLTLTDLHILCDCEIPEDLKRKFKSATQQLIPETETELKYQKYINSYTGKSLLEKHFLDEYGMWEIRGEDPNCDFGGTHIQPHLDTVECTLRTAIRHGVKLPNFWMWGAGGNFKKVTVRKI